MGLSRVWVQTLSDGLVRADQITGIDAHQTPALTGKPARWLLDVVLAVPIGSGHREGWTVTALHRTVIQTGHDPSTGRARAGPAAGPTGCHQRRRDHHAPRSSPIGVPAAKVGKAPRTEDEPRLPVGCGCGSRRSRSPHPAGTPARSTSERRVRGCGHGAGAAKPNVVIGGTAPARRASSTQRSCGHYRVGQRVERAPAQAAGLLRLAHPRLARPAGAREEEVHPLVDGPVVAVGAVHRGERHQRGGLDGHADLLRRLPARGGGDRLTRARRGPRRPSPSARRGSRCRAAGAAARPVPPEQHVRGRDDAEPHPTCPVRLSGLGARRWADLAGCTQPDHNAATSSP